MCLQISEKCSSASIAEHFKQISKCIRVKKKNWTLGKRCSRGTNQTEIKLVLLYIFIYMYMLT